MTGPLPASHAACVAGEVAGLLGGCGARRRPERHTVARCFKRSRVTLRELSPAAHGALGMGRGALRAPLCLPASAASGLAGDLRPELVDATLAQMRGRVLLDEQAQKAVSATGNFSLQQSEAVLSVACSVGLALFQPAVGIDAIGRYVCNRCGAKQGIVATACSRCGRAECHMCTECRAMGVSRECLGLYTVAGHSASADSGREAEPAAAAAPAPAPTYDYDLTAPQVDALAACREWYDTPRSVAGSELLVWAVCGAGKTEVAFGALAEAVARGVPAAFAVPRRDVAAEIHQRLDAAFPGMTAAAFYGGSDARSYDAPITVITCHQAMRFAGRFGLVVLDEADAFPYFGSDALSFSLCRAMAGDGRLITMTATPSASQVARARAGALPVVRITGRHHGRPLPVPTIDASRRDGPMEERVARTVSRSVAAGWPAFVFTPSKSACLSLFAHLSSSLQGVGVDWMHSGRHERDEVRRRFAERRVGVLVCTSVMERGITVEGADVVVASADATRIFDHRALVQMAGRSGRSHARPEGCVTFVCSAPTRAMKLAISMIEEMNEHARAMGYVSDNS